MLKIAVVTPYYNESIDILRNCHESVIRQSHECLHILVADGKPLHEINHWHAAHVQLPACHNDIGSTPRLIGAFHAIGLKYDAVAFLDADNWYGLDYIKNISRVLHADGPGFLSSGRMLCRIDGSEMRPCPFTNPETFIDTNCMIFTKKSFHLLHHWVLMPDYGHLIGDRIMLYHIKNSGVKHSHVPESIVYYRCKRDGIYRHFGEPIPPGALPKPNYADSFRRWSADGHPPLS